MLLSVFLCMCFCVCAFVCLCIYIYEHYFNQEGSSYIPGDECSGGEEAEVEIDGRHSFGQHFENLYFH